MKKIMFVCHGNICRSPMAEFMFKYMLSKKGKLNEYTVESCAVSSEELGNPIHYGTKTKLRENSIPFTERHAIKLLKNDYEKYDLFICMDRYNMKGALNIFGGDPQDKIHSLMEYCGMSKDVADPWYSHNFDDTYKDIKTGLEALYEELEDEKYEL